MDEPVPRASAAPSSRAARALPRAAGLAAGLLLSLYAFQRARRLEDAETRTRFERAAGAQAAAVRVALEHVGGDVAGAAAFVAATGTPPSPTAFQRLARSILAGHGLTQAISWVPRVPGRRRAELEQAERAAGRPAWAVYEQGPAGPLSAGARDEYFPVLHTAPLPSNEAALGFDVASEPRRRAALERARDTGMVTASPPLTLVLRGGPRGVLFLAPVYLGEPPASVDERRLALVGLVAGVHHAREFLAEALRGVPPEDLSLDLFDAAEPGGPEFLSGRGPGGITQAAAPAGPPGFRFEARLAAGGRIWLVRCTPTPAFVAAGRTSVPWLLLGGTFAIAGLLVAWVSSLGTRARRAREHVGQLLAAKQDLERQAEERRHAEAALSESEAQFRGLAEQAMVGVYLIQDGLFRYVNPRMASIFAYDAAALTGGMGPRDLTDPADWPRAEENLRRRIGGEVESINYEFRGRRRDGALLDIEVFGSRTLFHGRPAVVGTLLDVTGRKRLEAEMVRVEKLESLGVLAGGIAHDFNNILASILANISAAEGTVSDPAVAEILEDVHGATLRARDLTQQLLTFSRGGEPIRVAADLGRIARDATGFALRGSRVACAFDFAPDLWPAEVDPGQIGQVVHNLVLNAVQAMPEGGSIRVSAANVPDGDPARPALPAGPLVVVAVADEGVGIPREAQRKIFDPFFSTKTQGTGLGLSSAHSIVRRHGGHVAVESEPARGSTFRVYLPAGPGKAAEGASRHGLVVHGSGRVLVMDDEEIVRTAVGRLVTGLGYEVEYASDGTEAAERVREARAAGHPFDAVILDLTVPGGQGGREALPAIRAADPAVRAVVSSGYAKDPIMAEYARHGFAGVVAKPYDQAELSQVLARVLEK